MGKRVPGVYEGDNEGQVEEAMRRSLEEAFLRGSHPPTDTEAAQFEQAVRLSLENQQGGESDEEDEEEDEEEQLKRVMQQSLEDVQSGRRDAVSAEPQDEESALRDALRLSMLDAQRSAGRPSVLDGSAMLSVPEPGTRLRPDPAAIATLRELGDYTVAAAEAALADAEGDLDLAAAILISQGTTVSTGSAASPEGTGSTGPA